MRVNRGRAPSILNAELEDGERFAPQPGLSAPQPDGPLAVTINGTTGADGLSGTASADTINGLGGDDLLAGLDGDDVLNGGDDNDTLAGGRGNDLLDGGSGIDTISYALGADGVQVRLLTSSVTNLLGFDAGNDTLVSIENVIGTHSTDDIYGDANANVLNGLGSMDFLFGLDGNDTIDGGAGDDVINGGNGNDTIYAGDGDDGQQQFYIGVFYYDGITGGAGDDLIYGGAGNDGLFGGDDNDVVYGGDGNDGVSGGAGADFLYGEAGNDTISLFGADSGFGGSGADRMVISGSGMVLVDGGADLDTLDINSAVLFGPVMDIDLTLMWAGGDGRVGATGVVRNIERLGDVAGSSSNDSIIIGNGYLFGVTMYGAAGDDVLVGGGVADTLFGGAGADTLNGGAGIDTVSYDEFLTESAAVTVNLLTGTGSGGDAQGDTCVNIENVTGTDHGDTLVGNAGANRLIGLGGNDVMEGGDGADTLRGDSLNDVFLGATGGDDNLSGGAGNDFLDGGANNDILDGGTGNDTLEGDRENDILSGGDGDDSILGGFGADLLEGGAGADALDGGLGYAVQGINGTAEVLGGPGDTASYVGSDAAVTVSLATGSGSGGHAQGDTLTAIENLTGSAFNDSLTGDGGANNLTGGAGGDALNGGAGIDTAYYDGSSIGVRINLSTNLAVGGDATGDVLTGIENLVGSAFNDTLAGTAGVNLIRGGDGADSLSGLDDNDVLKGGWGADGLAGGNGIDTAHYGLTSLTEYTDIAGFHLGSAVYIAFEDFQDYLDGIFGDTDVFSPGVTVNLQTGLGSGGHAEGDMLNSIENVIGTINADTLIGDGGNNVLTGDMGADTIDGGGGTDTADYSFSSLDFVFPGFLSSGVTVNLLTGVNTGGAAQGDVLTSIENLIGTAFNDVLTGDGANNSLTGGAGLDTLNGGDGDDFLDGGEGNDNLTGGAGMDILEGYAGNDNLNGGDGDDGLAGWEGNDNISGGDGTDVLDGGDGDDNLNGGAGMDNLYGGDGTDTASYAGSDTAVNVNLQTGVNTGGWAQDDALSSIENLLGSSHADTLHGDWLNNLINGGDGNDSIGGGDGDDYIIGGAGADSIAGGAGSDTADYQASNVAVRVRLFAGTAEFGHAAGDMLTGVENLIGSAFNDQLAGDDFDNLIEGGAGADILGGRGGFDTLSYRSSNAAVIVNLANMTASGGHAAGDTFSSAFEAVLGSAFNDLLNGGNGNQTIEGGLGNDQMNGGNGYDTLSFARASNGVTVNLSLTTAQATGVGNDTITGFERLIGSAFNDTLTGDALDNVIIGGAGADAIVGGDGIDTVDYSASTDAVYARLGASAMGGPIFLGGDAQGDTLSGVENLIGTAFDDSLLGDTNANRLQGGAGADLLDGGAGTDWADYSLSDQAVAVSLTAQQGLGGHAAGDTLFNIENLQGSAFNDILVGNAGVNVLLGGAGADIMDGEGGIDWVSYAGSGAVTVNLTTNVGAGGHANGDTYADIESVIGSSYSDRVYGSAGYNAMAGEAGNDLLDGRGGNDSLNGGAGNDRLNGGSGADSFIFANDWGADTILDFSVSGGDIMVIDTSVFANFAAVIANTNDNGLGGTVISNGAVSITLNGVLKAQLTAGDFLFTALAPALPADKDDALTLPGLVEDDPLILPQDFGPSAKGADVYDIVPMDDLDPLILPVGLESKVTPDEAPVICPPGEADTIGARTEWDLAEMGLIDFDGRDPHRILMEPRGLDWIV